MNISLSKGIARQEVHKILFSFVALAYLITFIQKEYFVWRKSNSINNLYTSQGQSIYIRQYVNIYMYFNWLKKCQKIYAK